MPAVKFKRTGRARRSWWDGIRRYRRALRRGAAIVALLGFGSGATAAYWFTDWPEQGRAWALGQIESYSIALGLTVQEVRVSGRVETDPGAVLAAFAVPRDAPIFSVDLAEARRRLQALDWVREARIARRLPATLSIHIVERTPFAIWQHRGVQALIDREGEVMATARLERWANLPVVVGSGAPRAAAAMIDALASEPMLQARVVAAIRIGERRWNLRFDNGIEVLLPEEDHAGAIRRLADWQRTYNVLDRAVAAIDMRFADRLLLRLAPDAGPVLRDPGEST